MQATELMHQNPNPIMRSRKKTPKIVSGPLSFEAELAIRIEGDQIAKHIRWYSIKYLPRRMAIAALYKAGEGMYM
jgi:hypothetical protein